MLFVRTHGEEDAVTVHYSGAELRVAHETSHLLRALQSLRLRVHGCRQVPFQGLSVYHRQLTNNSTFTEVFSGIPASIGLVLVGLRDPTHSVHNNSELYETGGDAKYGWKRFSLQLGALTLPQPAAELDMAEIQAGRAFADYISAIGGDASSGNGGALASLSSWTKAPLLAYRILQEPGAYADTLTLRFDLKTALRSGNTSTASDKAVSLASVDASKDPYMSQPELVVGVIHQKVLEAFWDGPDTFPTRVVVDDVLN